MWIKPIETIEYKKFHIDIYQDEYPINPRKEYDNLGTMVCWHSRYALGDIQPNENPVEWLRELAQQHLDPDNEAKYIENMNEEEIWKILDKHYVFLNLYLLNHSGIAMKTTSFNDSWDSGQVGYIYVSKEKAKKESVDEKKIADILRQEVKIYEDFITGNVYGYMIKEADDSCWGFYGADFEKNGLLDSAKEVIDYEIEQINKEIASMNIKEIGEPRMA